MKCLFLYNPASGRGKTARKAARITKKLERVYEVDVHATESAEDLTEWVKRGAAGYDVIVFSGGDGTFQRVLEGLGDSRVQLGYLPAGTANDVARSLGIPRDPLRAIDVILKGRSAELDCMRINGTRYAMYIAAAGTPTRITYETPQSEKRAFGWFAYLFRGLGKCFPFESFPVRVECGQRVSEGDGMLVFVMNGRSVAGFPVNRSASMQDGTLELAVLKRGKGALGKFLSYLSLVRLMLFGIGRRRRRVDVMRGRHVRISTQKNLVWDFDGEEGTRGDIEIEVLPRRVRLFVPRGRKL